MKDGHVAEQGFRSDLMKKMPIHGQSLGVFAAMAVEQAIEPLPPKMEEWYNPHDEEEEVLHMDESVDQSNGLTRGRTPSLAASIRAGSVLYLDILEEYARGGRLSVEEEKRDPTRSSRPLSSAQKRLSWSPQELDNRRSNRNSLVVGNRNSLVGGNRNSLVFANRNSLVGANRNSLMALRPVSRMSRQGSYSGSPKLGFGGQDQPPLHHSPSEKDIVNHLDYNFQQKRTISENLEDDLKGLPVAIAFTDSPEPPQGKIRGVFALIVHFYPSLPSKYLLYIGVIGSIGHGITTPIWASYLSKLMQIVGAGGASSSLTRNSIIVLGLCAAQAFADFVQEYCLYALASRWTASVRSTAFGSVLAQDKGWFDESANSPSRLVQCLIKDADDMRLLMGSIMGKLVVFVAMVGLGIIWAMVVQWRLTLIGVALAPVFAMIMVVNESVIGKAEVRNKAKREAVARDFYEVSHTHNFWLRS